ncbi:alanine--tRNA ligase [Caldilinea sp.]|uniref:alanine--tRNA ligase n=1 Tax=Caldilinea sp. TaxID=2293560 RepID=UPI0021DE72C9|nr:alanine--tRNA ligase [Caldilinea sp.]GIV67233.1 MAG: alanine--tRNA ligase [Caldilinea sp.]
MKYLTTNQIRQYFLDFFHQRGHEIVPSSSLVPENDPTLLLTNAGMNQFKDVFLGLEKRPYKRAATVQKCMRVSGKHNDLENVGPSPRHHTFFEMLGNFSFGDYFKKDAIRFAWELLVDELELPLERLWFTVYEEDDEAERLWIETGADPSRVLRFGKSDNWWSMGDVGPCGPCSEIHYYWGDLEKQSAAGVNNSDEYLEIWNLVFMQYDAQPDGRLVPLPAPSVDTGAGLERLASILQGKDNNYDTDAFAPIMNRIQQLAGHSDAQRQEHLFRYRAIADHARACTFLIGDGVLPGNEGRQYVLRMILRRAARFGKIIGFERPFLAQVADAVIQEMGGHYTDLIPKRDYIMQTITDEEERFHRTLNNGLRILDEVMDRMRAEGRTQISGQEAFFLWDTFGFPIDLTRDIAKDNGFTVDEEGFRKALAEQKEKSRATAVEKVALDVKPYVEHFRKLQEQGVIDPAGVRHRIYEDLAEVDTTVAALFVNGEPVEEASVGQEVEVLLPETVFYVEAGGQVSDTGEIYYWPENLPEPVWSIQVTDMRRPIPGLILHVGKVTSGTVKVGDPAVAVIDTERRWDIMRNHTATHILHAALRERLGKHVHQAGSLVAPDRLRFDFTYGQPLSDEDIAAIERRANEIVLQNYPVNTRWTTYNQAISEGVTALFTEKYGDEVRVVSFGEEEGVSAELCGGTHVDSTAEVGPFRIVSEGSVAAGVRRIEAVTGRAAEALIEERLAALDAIAEMLHTKPAEAAEAVRELIARHHALQKEVAQLRQKLARQEAEALLQRAERVDGFSVLAVRVPAEDVETLRQMTDWFRDKLGSSVVAVGAVIDDKPLIVAAVTEDLVRRGMHAGNLVRDAAKLMGGGGGGRPTLAQAGGRDSAKLEEALQSIAQWVKTNLK